MVRKKLSADGMINTIKKSFLNIVDHRKKGIEGVTYSLQDSLMTAFAAFSLKYESFNSFFDDLEKEESKRVGVKSLYGLEKVPSNKRLKEIIDPIKTEDLRPAYNDIFREIQKGGALKNFLFMDRYYILALDGTGYYSSEKVHCPSCLVKNYKSGKTIYSHQMLAGCIVHPLMKQVIPVAPEPIQNTDGPTKNDCERNAAKRFLENFRKDHPKLPVIVTEDGLASNAPHIKELKKHDMSFILGVKPGDHKYLFDWINTHDEIRTHTNCSYKGKKVIRRITQEIRFINSVPLNDANSDLLVNFLELTETVEKKIEKYGYDEGTGKSSFEYEWVIEGKPTTFSWISDIKLNKENVFSIMLGGRKRWAIENETFNTLKNQGYNYEHSYGHGKENLATNFALLMMLAFLVDQVQEMCCSTFNKVLKKIGRKKYLWEEISSFFKRVTIKTNWEGLWKSILSPPIIEIGGG